MQPRPRPADLVSPWPTGRTSDSAGRVAASFARSLRKALGERQSVRAAAAACGLNHQTLHAILDGEVWPHMYTIAKLEEGLGLQLWPMITSGRD